MFASWEPRENRKEKAESTNKNREKSDSEEFKWEKKGEEIKGTYRILIIRV